MTPGPVDDYLHQLERELRQRGHAVNEGLGRGVSREDAEREAFERFGAPETVAEQAVAGRDVMIEQLVAMRNILWYRKWWVLAPTVATALLTSVLSYYFLPTRYRSESVVDIVSQPVPPELAQAAGDQSRALLQSISQTILSRSRLEWIAKDVGLDAAHQMRRNISVELLGAGQPDNEGAAGFRVSFESSNPQLALKITERLTSLFVEENLRQAEGRADVVNQFVEAEIADVRSRLVELEATLEKQQAQKGQGAVSRAEVLPYEVLQERYRMLLVRREDYRSAANLARRQLGAQFKVAQAAQLPERPVGPSRLGVNLTGALAGLAFGLVLVGVRGRSTPAS